MNKKMCIAGTIYTGEVRIKDLFGKELKLEASLPEGCLGITFVFESKKTAKKKFPKLKDSSFIIIKHVD